MSGKRGVAACLGALAVLAGGATSAHAAFPGLNGQIGFSTGPTPDLFAIDADGRNARPLAVRPARDEEPAWSPDGRRVAWVSYGTGRGQIMVADADGRNVRRFAPSQQGFDGSPSWSPDGRRIVFTSGREGTGTSEIFVADADGTNVRRLTFRPLEDGSPVFSPDGTKIVWNSRETTQERMHLYVMNADGSGQRRLVPNRSAPDTQASFSPDGRRILFMSYDDGYELWVADADGTDARKIVNRMRETYSPVWSPDGNRIAFVMRRGANQSFEVWVARSDGSDAEILLGIDRRAGGAQIDWQSFADRGGQPASLLEDGGAEDGFGGYFPQLAYLIPGWETNGGFTVLRYGLPGFPAYAIPPLVVAAQTPRNPRLDQDGRRFLFGGMSAVSTAVQDIRLTAPAAEIDTGRAKVTLSGLLGGRGAEADEGVVTGTFRSANGTALGLVQIGPVTPADRGNATRFLSRVETATLPAGTRSIRVTLTATRRAGTTNDAYFDNLALVYTTPEDPPPPGPPPPMPPPPPTAPGAPTGTASGAPNPTGVGRVSGLRISPSRFAVARANTALIAGSPQRRPPRGARVRFTLSRGGMVSLRLARLRPGRRAASGRCVAATRANRARSRCTRVTRIAALLRNARAGRNSVRFTGRVRRRALPPGTYRLIAFGENSARTTFRIVR